MVGESGCGKTTLARVLTGLYTPTRGTVRFAGRDLQALTPTSGATCARRCRWCSRIRLPRSTRASASAASSSLPFDVHGLPGGAERERRIVELLQLVGLDAQHLQR